MSLENISLFYSIYVNVCVSSENGNLVNDLIITVQKQLCNPNLLYKSVGIIGSIATIETLCSKNDVKQCISLLTLSLKCCWDSNTCLVLLFEKLSDFIERSCFTTTLVESISEIIDFPSHFMDDTGDIILKKGVKILMEIPGDEFPALKVHTSCHITFDNHKTHSVENSKVIVMCSLFRLMRSSVRFLTGSYDDIDAVLNCGIECWFVNSVREFEILSNRDKELYCFQVLMIINWFRELINTFAPNEFERCLRRIDDLIILENNLNSFIDLDGSSLRAISEKYIKYEDICLENIGKPPKTIRSLESLKRAYNVNLNLI